MRKKGERQSKQPQDQPQGGAKDPVKAYGVGLRESEWRKIESIAKELRVTKHGLAAWALKAFLKQWEEGEIETETKPSLPALD